MQPSAGLLSVPGLVPREKTAVTGRRDALLVGVQPIAAEADAVRIGHGCIGRADVVTAIWDFTVHGGSFGEREAGAFAVACEEAASTRRPLVSMIRSGGTRLQEGMRALVGIPRAVIALQQLAASGVPHIAVVDH